MRISFLCLDVCRCWSYIFLQVAHLQQCVQILVIYYSPGCTFATTSLQCAEKSLRKAVLCLLCSSPLPALPMRCSAHSRALHSSAGLPQTLHSNLCNIARCSVAGDKYSLLKIDFLLHAVFVKRQAAHRSRFREKVVADGQQQAGVSASTHFCRFCYYQQTCTVPKRASVPCTKLRLPSSLCSRTAAVIALCIATVA